MNFQLKVGKNILDNKLKSYKIAKKNIISSIHTLSFSSWNIGFFKIA